MKLIERQRELVGSWLKIDIDWNKRPNDRETFEKFHFHCFLLS